MKRRLGLTWAAVLLTVCHVGVSAHQVSAGGGVAPYTGGGSRQRGFGYVSDAAFGFFVAGSSLTNMNGVYMRIQPDKIPDHIRHKWQYAYHNDHSGWFMGLVGAPDGNMVPKPYEPVGGKSTEWVIIDEQGNDRFGHVGETVIPGAGMKWKHVQERNAAKGTGSNHFGDEDPPSSEEAERKGAKPGGAEKGRAVAEKLGDREDELPWQVIYIGDQKMAHQLRNQHRWNEHIKKQAMLGDAIFDGQEMRPIKKVPLQDQAGEQPRAPPEEVAAELVDPPAAVAAREEGDWAAAAALYMEALGALNPNDTSLTPEQREWNEAYLHLLHAAMLRRAHSYADALSSLEQALALFPQYKAALFEKGSCLLDAQEPVKAVEAFEQVLALDVEYPGLCARLVRATADVARIDALGPGLEDALGINHYAVLGLGYDFTPKELTKAYRSASRTYHPDKKGGSTQAFERVAAAHACLSSEAARKEYDAGAEIKRDLQQDGSQGPTWEDRMTKRYFPQRFGFEPFGDPYEHKRARKEERLLETPAADNQEGIPEGTYLGSCKGCSLSADGETLTCTHCLATNTRPRQASIGARSCAAGDVIGNSDGRLACEPVAAAALLDDSGGVTDGGSSPQKRAEPRTEFDANGNHPSAPEGPYRESCTQCALLPPNNQVLSCTCRGEGGGLLETALELLVCSGVIDNKGGELVCDGVSFPPRLHHGEEL
jgi:tetratricopeptide (TPR) repeat protein